MNIYFLPGLGFDQRIFKNLKLVGLSCNFINWIEPQSANETIQEYAARMAKVIDTTQPIILIGHSLGGVVSQEIACQLEVAKVFLISSIQSRIELPRQFKIIQRFNLHKHFNKSFIIKSHDYWGASYGYKTKEERALFKDMIDKQSNTYLQWALKALSMWQTPDVPSATEIIQIHGDQDKTFPIKLLKSPDEILRGAGHFMVYQEAVLLSQLIQKKLT